MTKEKWNWEVINGEVFIVSGGLKIAKMLPDEVGQQQMVKNTTTITVLVNEHNAKKEELLNTNQ